MKKLLLSAILLSGVFSVEAQNYYPTGSIQSPTWFYSNVVADDDGNYYNAKTQKSGNVIDDAYFNGVLSSHGDAYDGAFEFFVNTEDSVYTESGTVDTTGTTITLAEQLIDGLYVSKSYFFSTTDPVVRAAFKIRNPGASAKTAKIGIFTNFGSDNATRLDSCSTASMSLSDQDRWMITSDGGPSDPVNTSVRFGPGVVASTPVFGYKPESGNDDFLDTVTVNVPANSYRLILQFNRIDTTLETAKANVYKFNSVASLNAAGYLQGLSNADLDKVVNWNFGTITSSSTADVSNRVNIFPVPASQSVTVNYGNTFDGNAQLSVKDVTGVTFFSKELSESGQSIDVSSLDAGMYILEIKSNDKVAYKKLIKN